jgi:O-succinylbenzoic acid--CoA ligase
MPDPIARHAAGRPEAPALTGAGDVWSYAALDAAVARTQARLEARGIGPGDRVALHRAPSAALVQLFWALWRAGAVAVPLSTREPPSTVAAQAEQAGADLLVTETLGGNEAAAEGAAVCAPGALVGPDGPTVRPTPRPPTRPATVLYTSGSTGPPKAALHTWANHLYSAKGANANLPLRAGDRWLLSLPLYHVGGVAILVRCALAGAAVALPPPGAPPAEALPATRATHVSMVATQLRRLLHATDGAPPPRLRAVLLGGGPIPDALLRAGTDRGWPLLTSYGCTEMASQVTTTAPGAVLGTLRTAGRRLPHRRLRIRDGRILVGGPPLFTGYLTDDGLVDPRDEDGWYATGDLGRIDAQGRLHVEGRVDHMFVSGGENVVPEEIEAALEREPVVVRAVVVPVPDPEYGRRPVAFVQARDAWTEAGLRAALEETLPGFKIPDAFHSLPEEAGTGRLKIDRTALARRARALRNH